MWAFFSASQKFFCDERHERKAVQTQLGHVLLVGLNILHDLISFPKSCSVEIDFIVFGFWRVIFFRKVFLTAVHRAMNLKVSESELVGHLFCLSVGDTHPLFPSVPHKPCK